MPRRSSGGAFFRADRATGGRYDPEQPSIQRDLQTYTAPVAESLIGATNTANDPRPIPQISTLASSPDTGDGTLFSWYLDDILGRLERRDPELAHAFRERFVDQNGMIPPEARQYIDRFQADNLNLSPGALIYGLVASVSAQPEKPTPTPRRAVASHATQTSAGISRRGLHTAKQQNSWAQSVTAAFDFIFGNTGRLEFFLINSTAGLINRTARAVTESVFDPTNRNLQISLGAVPYMLGIADLMAHPSHREVLANVLQALVGH